MRGWIALALLLAGSAAPTTVQAASGLEEVPVPDLSALAVESREQLLEARERLDGALASPGGAEGVDDLADLFGRMGELYYLYELLIPAGICFDNARTLAPADYRWPYFLGAIASARGDVEGAVELFSRAAELEPDDAAVHLRLGRLYLDLDQLERARSHFERALALDPESAAAHEGIGRTARAFGDLSTALEHLNEALRLQPTATSLHFQLGMVYRELGDREQARSHLMKNRHHPVVMRDPLVNQLAREGRGPRRFLEAGQEALDRGNYETAVTAFRQVVARSPEDPRARYNLALALSGLGQLEESIAELRHALELDPEYADALFNLGANLARSGRYEEAAEAYGRLLALAPDDSAARVQRANALRSAGRIDQAASEIEGLLAKDPDHVEALLLSAAMLRDRGDLPRAEERLRRVARLAAEPGLRSEALMALGDLARAQGRLEEALNHFEQARAATPDSPRAVAGLAFVLGGLGRFSASAEAFTALVALTPGDPNAHFGRAMARLLGGDEVAAVRGLDEAIGRLPESLPLRHLLARVLATARDAAARDGRRALDLALAAQRAAPSVEHAETVAMAFAEVGEFERAIEWQERAIAAAESRTGPGSAGAARARLERYRSGEPVRAPWLG